MEPHRETDQTEKPLRLIAPAFYNRLIAQFESYHIHPYDIQIRGVEEDSGMTVILRYGEGFTQSRTRHFTLYTIENGESEIDEWVEETGVACQEVLVADYYKMMKP